jgi:hypothetical protein
MQQFSSLFSDVYLQLNMFPEFSHPSSGAQRLQWHPLVLPSYRGDSRAVFVVGPVMGNRSVQHTPVPHNRRDHEQSTTVTTIRR